MRQKYDWTDLREAIIAMREVEILPWRCVDHRHCRKGRHAVLNFAQLTGMNLRTVIDGHMLYVIRLMNRSEAQ